MADRQPCRRGRTLGKEYNATVMRASYAPAFDRRCVDLVRPTALSPRTDIEFWTLLKRHEARTAALQQRFSEAEAVGHLHRLNPDDLRVIDALVEGHHRPTVKELRDAAKRYPYLAFAIVQAHLAEIRARSAARLQAAQDYHELVLQFEEGEPSAPACG